MKKLSKILISLTLILALSTSLSASTLTRDVKGKENKEIKITYDGQPITLKDGNGKVIYPVIINGSTYLPVRAVTEMVGCDISWEGTTKTIHIVSNGAKEPSDVPTDLKPTNGNTQKPKPTSTTKPQTQTGNKSYDAATLNDPVEFGKTFSYDDPYTYDGVTTNAHYDVTITGSKKINANDVANLGFKKPKDDGITEYALVDVNLKVSNASYKGDDYRYLSQFKPDMFGSYTSTGRSIICGTDYGFTGCLNDAISKATNFQKVNSDGKTYSYQASGKILIAIYKNVENYITFQKSDTTNYNASKLHFKLQNGNSTSYKPDNKPQTQPTQNTGTSTNAGTLSNPVEFGKTFTYTDTFYYHDALNRKGTYDVTIVDAVKVNPSDYSKYELETKNGVGYVEATVRVKGYDISYYGSDDCLLGAFRPNFYGSYTPSGTYQFGSETYYSDDAYDKVFNKLVWNEENVVPGQTRSYSVVEGKIIIPIKQNTENYFTINVHTGNLQSKKIYFKLH